MTRETDPLMADYFSYDDAYGMLFEAVGASSQRAVARQAGVSESRVSQVLTDRKPLGPKLSAFLGLEQERLVTVRYLAKGAA